jgi:N-terminal domain of Peptidase_S41 in eukaryotic IRBP
VEQAAVERLERLIDREVKARFLAGGVRRVAVLQHGDDPAIEPGELTVRLFIETGGGPDDGQRSLDVWAGAHQAAMKRIRRELSLRLPPARLLEFTVDGASDPGAAPRITMEDDPALTSAPLSGPEIVEAALALLRSSYVFPDRAEQAAEEVESRLAAGEYDGLGEATLAERLTDHLNEVCADKHLRVRVMPPLPAGPERAGPERAGPEGGPPRRAGSGPGGKRGPDDRGPDGPGRGHPLNYGIHRVERLEGNVGYLDLHGVAHPDDAGPAIAAAMELVSGTYALIIDLRRNHGGSPDGVAFWCSYLFPGGGVHLSDIFHADTGETSSSGPWPTSRGTAISIGLSTC